tara:strand:- start:2336 stop:2677 length:342 start_codon:yes stop_codon:yes gene_type:complete
MANSRRAYKPKPFKQRKLALERITALFKEAASAFKEDKKLANRYVSLARKIAMKYKVRIPSELRKRFCKHCHTYLKPNINLRIRTNKGKVVYYCLECKKFMRFPYKTKIKSKA